MFKKDHFYRVRLETKRNDRSNNRYAWKHHYVTTTTLEKVSWWHVDQH